MMFEKGRMVFDLDLCQNSDSSLETLVRVGMSVGHSPEVEEFRA
jgi:phosphatidylserine decarboxylase